MPQITIDIDEDVKKIISKRAKANLFTLREQIEDILRKSAIRTKNSEKYKTIKIDDKLVAVFSRERRGPKKKTSKKKKSKKK
ncbi:hypothetical protein KAI04_02875 [Candidatus Pacearchaeota archaeon]|nr:hypothetical protein [Candidatus Pacearchaeota archaeon]